MKYPATLQVGDTVGLICTSTPISLEKVAQCKNALEGMGFPVKLSHSLTCNHKGYTAGSGELRGHDINTMFSDPEVKAIFCVRGGYGGSHTINHINFDRLNHNPKIFVGYSDVTCIHCAIRKHCNFVTYHGPMVAPDMVPSFDAISMASLFHALNASTPYIFQNPINSPIKALKGGYGSGILTGGNLSLISATLGTSYEIDTKGTILFLEEVNEPVSRIDRFIYHLKHAGAFEDCVGVLLGQFTNCINDFCPSETYLTLFQEVFQGYHFPVLYNIQSGHCKPNLTLPLGMYCTVDGWNASISFYP